ncbi:MAG: NADPH:quinone oxidoreductase family protein [Sphingomonadales bacterium]|nr:NADPH:quinone oxidoreductase family protein [Sphingomonadales bacterium]
MPKAIIGHAFGPPETYALHDFDPGPPGEGQLRVAIKAAGISYVDVLTARGEYQFKPPLPFIPGSEYAGVIEAIGPGVAGFAIGERVYGTGMGGILAEVGNFAAANVSRVPAGMSLETAAVFSVNYLTAWHALADRARARAGEVLLVLGAAGGTGFAAIEVGKHLGLKVIASASSADKRAVALAGGADAAVDSGAADWREAVKAANGGKPIDIVFDGVGGEATERAFRTLGYDGRHLVVGFPAGIPALKTNLALLKSASLVGVHVRHAGMERPDLLAEGRKRIAEMAESGLVRPAIAGRYAMADYVRAMDQAFSGKAAGRILMVMG